MSECSWSFLTQDTYNVEFSGNLFDMDIPRNSVLGGERLEISFSQPTENIRVFRTKPYTYDFIVADDEMQIPFEVNALSAHRTPEAVEAFAKGAKERGLKVIIAAAGMAAALPGVIAASTTLPVIGVPIKGMLDGLDAMLSIIQMPPGIPVATVGVNGAQNAAILAVEMLALSDEAIAQRLADYKSGLKAKIEKANKDLAEVKYEYKTN